MRRGGESARQSDAPGHHWRLERALRFAQGRHQRLWLPLSAQRVDLLRARVSGRAGQQGSASVPDLPPPSAAFSAA